MGVPRADDRRVLNGIFRAPRPHARDLPLALRPPLHLLQSLRAKADGKQVTPVDGLHHRSAGWR